MAGTSKHQPDAQADAGAIQKCGLVMPIADFGDYSADHWLAVREILIEAISDAGYEAKLVSEENASGVIHQRIITNLFTNPIIVCDVSARNPNVMFELGMRLAFDKPTIIVKDDATPFSFDIGVVEHVPYPRSLHYHGVNKFKAELTARILATVKEAAADPNYSTYIKHISGVKPATMNVREIPVEEFLLSRLEEMSLKIDRISPPDIPRTIGRTHFNFAGYRGISIETAGMSDTDINAMSDAVSRVSGVRSVRRSENDIIVTFVDSANSKRLRNEVVLTAAPFTKDVTMTVREL